MVKYPKLVSAAAVSCLSLLILPLALFSATTTGGAGKYSSLVRTLSAKHGVPEALIHSIIRAESNYDPSAVSSKGAVGLMQLMPGTAQEYGVEDPTVPEDNLSAGIRFIKKLMDLYDGDVKLVLAAYNAGPAAVEKYGGVPPYPETRNYIERIRRSFNEPVILRKKIYSFTDRSGRIVLTNMPYLNRKKLPALEGRDGAGAPDQR